MTASFTWSLLADALHQYFIVPHLFLRSLLSPWHSAWNLASVLEFCWTDHGIWHSGRICTEIMGIVFPLLCLVILYRVWPNSMKKKMRSMECLVDFHGTSPRSSHEIIHVIVSCVRTKQTMFVWHHAHQTQPTLFFPPPPSHHHHHLTTTNHAHHCCQLCSSPPLTFVTAHKCQWPHCHHDCLKNEADHPQTKMAATYQPLLVNDGQQPCMDTGNCLHHHLFAAQVFYEMKWLGKLYDIILFHFYNLCHSMSIFPILISFAFHSPLVAMFFDISFFP